MTIEIKQKTNCETCSGKGFIVRHPGPITNRININELSKSSLNSKQLKEILASREIHIEGVTDQELQIVCNLCNGSGKIEKNLTLDELKELLK
jgi:DnaJ-class molecular chaperone